MPIAHRCSKLLPCHFELVSPTPSPHAKYSLSSWGEGFVLLFFFGCAIVGVYMFLKIRRLQRESGVGGSRNWRGEGAGFGSGGFSSNDNQPRFDSVSYDPLSNYNSFAFDDDMDVELANVNFKGEVPSAVAGMKLHSAGSNLFIPPQSHSQGAKSAQLVDTAADEDDPDELFKWAEANLPRGGESTDRRI
ncbi:hypothetical protein BJ742DRAFT_569371 [Cladochytrium replicatum]|nr:hypothetical protein BJ742DRAFT_569371 [Cladochytrium replicatum]